jgi:hypothetical protein
MIDCDGKSQKVVENKYLYIILVGLDMTRFHEKYGRFGAVKDAGTNQEKTRNETSLRALRWSSG